VVLTLDAKGKVSKSRLATALGAEHFMPNPTGIAFAPNGFFATIHDINTVTQESTPWDFMGPTLWTQTWFDGGHGSHMDMLHNSPSGIGIAWVHGNTYVVNDGAHGSITVYDFRNDHNYGGSDHSDGVTLRYADGLLERVEGVPAHIVFDKATGLAYAVDTGHNRVVSVDLGLDYLTKSGFDYISIKNKNYKVSRVLDPNYDGTIQRFVDGPVTNTVIDGAKSKLSTPSGIALYNDLLYVSDYTNGQIHAFSKEGKLLDSLTLSDVLPAAANSALSGIEFDAKGNLYITDLLNNRVYRLEVAAK
jgi:DNA-binding beta-propeller fold protein YncE